MSTQEAVMRKRLQALLVDMLKMGTVRGFKYFNMFLRGREEILLSVVNDLSITKEESMNDPLSTSFNSVNIPYSKKSLMLPVTTNTRRLSGEVALPPASPCDREIIEDGNCTCFLLAAYNRYSRPYVWIRSNHSRLVRLQEDKGQGEKDRPLKLRTTLGWKESDIKVWHIIAELVKLCTYPPPLNPFSVNMEFFEEMSVQERLFATGAMMSFLQKIIINSSEDKPYTAKVLEDLELVTKSHFRCLQQLSSQGQLPIMQSSKQQTKTVSPQGQTGISYSQHKQNNGSSGLFQYKYHTGVI